MRAQDDMNHTFCACSKTLFFSLNAAQSGNVFFRDPPTVNLELMAKDLRESTCLTMGKNQDQFKFVITYGYDCSN